MGLTNASAIVTGGAGGFGSATVRRLAERKGGDMRLLKAL
jgi:NAD(P)-dependent dehydrogenase (short-subunit alcohol dehydrogenase family)